MAQKIYFEGNRGILFLPTTKEASWSWLLGEVVVDWLDVPVGSLLYEDLNGKLLPTRTDIRVVYYDAYNHPQGDQKRSDCHQSELRPPPNLNWVLILFVMSRLIQSQLIYLILIMFHLIQGYHVMMGVEVPDSCLSVTDSAPKHPSLR